MVETEQSTEEGSTVVVSTAVEKSNQTSGSSKEPTSLFHGSSYKAIVSRSGAACRLHSPLPVRLHFVVRQHPPSSPSDPPRNLPDGEYGYFDGDIPCASVTRASLLHSVTVE